MSLKLRKDDVVYYKFALRGLIKEAKENGIKVTVSRHGSNGNAYVMFVSEIGELTVVEFDYV